jgi:hypothetical protein
MKTMMERYQPLRAADDGGAGGAGGGGAGGAGSAAGAGAAGDGGSAAAGASGAGAGDGGAAAAAAAAAAAGDGTAGAAASAAEPYRPQGLPDTMFGKDDRETMDKMAEALKGYRTRDSQVPADAAAYKAFDIETVDEALRPHLQGLDGDPVFDAAAKFALENKVPVPIMQGMVAAVYAEAVKQGLFEGFVDAKAERAQLVPDEAKTLPADRQEAAIEARLQANEDFIKLLAKDEGGLPQDVAEHALLMLMDTAKGNRFIEFMKARMTGEGRAQPHAGAGHGGSTDTRRAQLRAERAKPEMNPQHPKFDRAAYDRLDEEYRKLFPG